MSRFEIDDLIEIIASHPDGLTLKMLCSEYEIKFKTWIQPEHETQIKNCLKANTDRVYCDASGVWHIKLQTAPIPTVAPASQASKGTEVRNRDDLFFKTPEGQAFLKLFDYIGKRYNIDPLPMKGESGSDSFHDLRDESKRDICYRFSYMGRRLGRIYYKNGVRSVRSSLEIYTSVVKSERIEENVDLSLFTNGVYEANKDSTSKFWITDFENIEPIIGALCDQIDECLTL
ncbi:hypothetical protein [Ruminococcus sp.]|uniref:hypothetical protein n=1 Tax=Ruminococcus sp. TaxID=41978 RepID=UPI0025E4356B|nr:hypothetical protein [Ruminococcus sp.]MBR1432486.1 hypothetical protein [Ruminococcus sp.]